MGPTLSRGNEPSRPQQTVRRLTMSVLLVVLVGHGGCATTMEPPRVLSTAPPEDVLQSLRTIGVIAGNLPHEVELTRPKPVGEAARMGAAKGAALTFKGFTYTCTFAFGYLWIIGVIPCAAAGALLAPVGAGVGAGVGAMITEASAKVEAAPALVLKLLTEADVTGALRDRVTILGNEWTRWRQWRFVILPDDGPDTPERGSPALLERGVDTVLEVNVEGIGLAGAETQINPPLALVVIVRTRLLRVPDMDVLHENLLTWESARHRLGEWVADDGGRLREEMRQTSRGLGERIVDEVFLLFPPLENIPSMDARIISERIKFLRDGSTTRQEILDRLGEPARRYEGGRVLTFLMYGDHRGQLRPSPLPGYGSARYRLVLIFGRDDRLEAHRLVRLDR